MHDTYTEERKLLTTYPKDFNPKDPKRICIFGERMRALRENVETRNAQIIYDNGKPILGPAYCDIRTQEDLARKLHVSTMWVSNYESGRKKSVPMNKLLEICDAYDATPHYLLGYSSEPDRIITFDANGNIECDSKGKPIETVMPFFWPELAQTQAYMNFVEIEKANPKHFRILCELLNSSKKVQIICFSVISTLLRLNLDE